MSEIKGDQMAHKLHYSSKRWFRNSCLYAFRCAGRAI